MILALYEARRDITLDELRRELGQAGVTWTATNMTRSMAAAVAASGCGWATRTATARRPRWSPACA
jgi:hypothetical protein